MLRVALCLLVCILSAVNAATDDDVQARLIGTKTVLNHFIVEKKELTLEYILQNIGTTSAYAIELKDENFPAEYFKVKSGSLSSRWNSLPPGANVTHSVVLEPRSAGYFNFSSALISYKTSQDSGHITFGYTSAPGELSIFPLTDFNKHHSSHLSDWLSFALVCTPSLLIPFVLWFVSKSKYESKQGKSKKN